MIITFASSKGGVGKSTLTACLAGALAARGARVHIFDLDKNAVILNWLDEFPQDNIDASVTDADDLIAEIQEKGQSGTVDAILIDVAGVYERALTKAMARASLVIVPAKPSTPDFREAFRVIKDLDEMNQAFGVTIPYRLALNECDPLSNNTLQNEAVDSLDERGIPRFSTLIHNRRPYRHVFASGPTPHSGDQSHESTRKAREEIDAVLAEIDAIHTPAPAPETVG